MEIYNGTYCVYVHTNKINGKMYVGQTRQRPDKRWMNGLGYKLCTLFWKAIKKYGWDNFEHEIIASNLTLEEANHFEELIIRHLHTTDPEYGYNLRSGGENNYLSEETKKKIGGTNSGENNGMYGKKGVLCCNFGRPCSDETKAKISEANKGRLAGAKNPMYGKHPSEESRKKMSEAHIGLQAGLKSPHIKSVLQFSINGTFIRQWDYITEAANELHISNSNISACCKGRYKSAGGFIWKYADDFTNNTK